jgi:hypothetical protein
MVAGSQVAHVFAYRLVYPQAQVRVRDLLATGHGYMLGRLGFLPLVLGVVLGLELVALGWTVAGAVRERWARPVPAWAFALLPLVGFTVQEFAERWFETGSFPWWAVEQPTFRVGLLLQLPFGLLAFLVAWLLQRVAERVAYVLRPSVALPRLGALPVRRSFVSAWLPRTSVLADGHAGRGPPVIGAALL